MAVHLLIAPAACGKTRYVLNCAKEAARGLEGTPRIIVPTHLQARHLRRRLAEEGGGMGIRIQTFDRLVADCLNATGETYTELSPPVRYRLLRSVVDALASGDGLSLEHYRSLVTRPGFIRALEGIIGEMKAGMILPRSFARAVEAMGNEPRLRELADIYTAYQQQLQQNNWADREGLIWLAVEALKRHPELGRDWPLLAVDGFDDLTPAQLEVLALLAERVREMIVTLTGDAGGKERPLVHRRFQRTRQRLEKRFKVKGEPLPDSASIPAPFSILEACLFSTASSPATDVRNSIELIEAPNRAAEARAALRWLKARIAQDGMRPDQVALLARNVQPYRSFILQIAAEFGLPIRLVDGLPLRHNPAVAALLDLLRLMLPLSSENSEPALPPRLVVEAWRSPYFDWSALPEEGAPEPIGITPQDADTLDAAARWGRVVGGFSQWEETFHQLQGLEERSTQEAEEEEEIAPIPSGLPRREKATRLWERFARFIRRLTPPEGRQSYRTFVGWLEGLIGSDPVLHSREYPLPKEPTSLRVVKRARDGGGAIAERDVAALQAFKDVLRGLVWAEEALGTQPVTFSEFFKELSGVVEAATYHLPVKDKQEEILVADVVQARGLSFRAVAIIGLAEGEFPASLSENPFLRDVDRQRLQEHGIRLNPSTESAEAEFFYEAVTRARERLLLTRPCMADTGAPWEPSPFWEEVQRLIQGVPQKVRVGPDQAASWPELLEILAEQGHAANAIGGWASRADGEKRAEAIEHAREVLRQRRRGEPHRLYDGNLTTLANQLAQEFGPDYFWSAGRLETYQSCPFRFFVTYVLGLKPRPVPVEGLDRRQLGSIYHRLLAKVYRAAEDPTNPDSLLKALEQVGGTVLDQAPEREGFRETAWWRETCGEILATTCQTLEKLAQEGEDFTPTYYEMAFGIGDKPALVIRDEQGDSFRLWGVIDRVDVRGNGEVRVIDYKTGGTSGYNQQALEKGKTLQIFLYAKAAQEALQLGTVVEGFYWHIRDGKPSLRLSKCGHQEAVAKAVAHAWTVVRKVRAGQFSPIPPADGCPDYCPAVAFCWHYRPRSR